MPLARLTQWCSHHPLSDLSDLSDSSDKKLVDPLTC